MDAYEGFKVRVEVLLNDASHVMDVEGGLHHKPDDEGRLATSYRHADKEYEPVLRVGSPLIGVWHVHGRRKLDGDVHVLP